MFEAFLEQKVITNIKTSVTFYDLTFCERIRFVTSSFFITLLIFLYVDVLWFEDGMTWDDFFAY